MGAKPGNRAPGKSKGRLSAGAWALIAIIVLFAGYAALLEYSRPHVTGDRLTLDRFIDLAERDRMQDARILDVDAYVVGSYRPPGSSDVRRYNTPYYKAESLRESLTNVLVPNRIRTTVDQQTGKRFIGPLSLLIPALIVVVVFVYFILSYRAGTGLFSTRSGARRIEAQEGDITFADVAAQDAAVAELREISAFLSAPERFAAMGSRMPRGILLFGPPGCGKTLMARALAGEAGAAFYSISGSDFVELYVGVGAARVRELFKEARENAPAIVFIDELDSVASRRAAGGMLATSSGAEQEQALNQILAEMDGFSPTDGIMLVGATNRPDILDPALLRPGRFDRSIGLELPDQKGRHAILSVHARGRPLAPDADLAALAERAVGMTGADLASVVNEAGLLAGRAGGTQIAQEHLLAAMERVMEAPEHQRRLSMRERSVGRQTLSGDRMTFADVAGADDAITELAEIRDYLGAPDRFADMGARIPRGYLLSGPPGCGKTLLARAVAGEANATFISVSGTDFVQRYVGEGAGRVRDLFAEARSMAPAILFIDEIDAVGGRRGGLVNDHSERHQTLNQILIELDGFSQRAGVVVMAATNRLDTLDPALVRPGRFDRQVTMELPDLDARRAILDVHAKGKPLAADADLDAIARLTRGMAGADLANVMNEAALLAARGNAAAITMTVLQEACDRASLGIGGVRRMSDEDRRLVAYHEAGHGLVAMALPGGRILHKITIIPRGHSLGAAYLPAADERRTHSRSLLMERMATLLGGRTAEEMIFGEVGDGAASDLAAVAHIARQMVSQLGMSDAVGAINYADEVGNDGMRVHSEETARLIDSEVRRLVAEAGKMARRVLEDSRDALHRVADSLMERETLTLEEVEMIVRPGAGAARVEDGTVTPWQPIPPAYR